MIRSLEWLMFSIGNSVLYFILCMLDDGFVMRTSTSYGRPNAFDNVLYLMILIMFSYVIHTTYFSDFVP